MREDFFQPWKDLKMEADEVRSEADRLSEYYLKRGITSEFISPGLLKRFVCKSKSLKRVFTIGEKAVNYSALTLRS